ncbi:type II toxin-antitoxin system RelE/ParE family toxin [Sulfurirhabdus autotrophica]|uniref:mRNA-degrading endonuclease YafQ of YafQ-DinJ toxin-antitoxin module n=1 Tax=Sulfurirhabdus autotrophica TaxID=1706046 RepID=A0A4R3YIT5_9PROT|nr:plasmid stabilization protein [Sulfurirhabdus autotrophica]TCV90593.1 mRNA-degrading endonuclease YafQ of YafQ-DinJ toxin-antitoxin module [Sulfurirhabdus autotrophica]
MSWSLATTAFFDRRARKFLTKHPDLRPRFIETMEQLCDDPFQPSLRLHPLSGKLQGLQAVSLTYSYRITLTVQVTEHEILLLDIGSHDEVYG